MVRCVDPTVVADMMPRLARVSVPTLKSWYDPELLVENSIPPKIWYKDVFAFQWLSDNFVKLNVFYRDAAQQGNGLLIYTT